MIVLQSSSEARRDHDEPCEGRFRRVIEVVLETVPGVPGPGMTAEDRGYGQFFTYREMFPPPMPPTSWIPGAMTSSGIRRFIWLHHAASSVVYPRSPRASRNERPAVRARTASAIESMLLGPPKSADAANVKCVADSSFHRGPRTSNAFRRTVPGWDRKRTHPTELAMTRVTRRVAMTFEGRATGLP